MLIIRQFKKGEEKALRQLFFDSIRKVAIKDYTQSQVEVWASEQYDEALWAQRIYTISPFIADLDGKIVGYADIQKDGYIDHFYCHYQHQSQGVGKLLMQRIHERGVEMGISRYYSHVSKTARPFFEHFGFQVIREQQVAVKDQILTNYVMEKMSLPAN